MKRIKAPVVAAIASAALTAGVVGGVAVAQTGDTVITACVSQNSGHIRIVTSTDDCRANETPMQWNKEGRQGPIGPAGTNGTDGVDGVSGRVEASNSVSVPPGETRLIIATCPEGTKVLGGGFRSGMLADLSTLRVSQSAPHPSSGWAVFAGNPNATTFGLDVWAICATAG